MTYEDKPAPAVPDDASPELIAMNEALWAWTNVGSFKVKVALMQCLHKHDEQARIINQCIGDIARAWGAYLETVAHVHPCPEEHDDPERIGREGFEDHALRAVEDLPGPFGTSCPCGSTTHVLSTHPTRHRAGFTEKLGTYDIADPIAEHRDGEHDQNPDAECCAACVIVLARIAGIEPETYAKYVGHLPTEGPSR